MRKKTILLSERTLMFSVGGQLFDQAPNRHPRNAETIMTKLRDSFRAVAYNDNEYYTIRVAEDGMEKFVDYILKAIPEFLDLNLTQIEFENLVSVNDETRPKYGFTSRYDKHDSESWKRDFIDLDAFVRNVTGNIFMFDNADNDCFLCPREGTDRTECNICNRNPKLKDMYESPRQPRGEYTFACKFDCFKSRYICCEECKDKDTCKDKCKDSSESCGLAMNRKGKK